jgi:glucuronosyltransferase
MFTISGTSDMYIIDTLWYFQSVNVFWHMGIKLCNILLQDEALQDILNANEEKFDILITGAFFYDCVLGIGYKLNIPVIKICPFVGTKWMDEWAANPSPYAYVPDVLQELGERMTFWQRIRNTVGEIYIKLGRMFYVVPQHDAILRKYLNTSNIPSVSELGKSVALILLNHHFSIGYPRPFVPSMVEVGGIHITSPKKLSAVSMNAKE